MTPSKDHIRSQLESELARWLDATSRPLGTPPALGSARLKDFDKRLEIVIPQIDVISRSFNCSPSGRCVLSAVFDMSWPEIDQSVMRDTLQIIRNPDGSTSFSNKGAHIVG